MCWSTCTIENSVSRILYGLVSSFRGVLMVLVRFTLPTVNAECTKDIFNFVTNNGLTLSLRSRLGAPHWIMSSLRVFANWLFFLIPWTSVTLVEVPKNMTAAVEPSKIAGTLEYTISQATSSLRL
jgi:hypothetical protein